MVIFLMTQVLPLSLVSGSVYLAPCDGLIV